MKTVYTETYIKINKKHVQRCTGGASNTEIRKKDLETNMG